MPSVCEEPDLAGVNLAPTGLNKAAQGNALGPGCATHPQALKGRHYLRRERARRASGRSVRKKLAQTALLNAMVVGEEPERAALRRPARRFT